MILWCIDSNNDRAHVTVHSGLLGTPPGVFLNSVGTAGHVAKGSRVLNC